MVQDCIRLVNNIKLQESYSSPASPYFADFVSRGDFRIKVTGMVEVSLKSVNCRFWSQVCLGRKVTIFAHSGIAYIKKKNHVYGKWQTSNLS